MVSIKWLISLSYDFILSFNRLNFPPNVFFYLRFRIFIVTLEFLRILVLVIFLFLFLCLFFFISSFFPHFPFFLFLFPPPFFFSFFPICIISSIWSAIFLERRSRDFLLPWKFYWPFFFWVSQTICFMMLVLFFKKVKFWNSAQNVLKFGLKCSSSFILIWSGCFFFFFFFL